MRHQHFLFAQQKKPEGRQGRSAAIRAHVLTIVAAVQCLRVPVAEAIDRQKSRSRLSRSDWQRIETKVRRSIRRTY